MNDINRISANTARILKRICTEEILYFLAHNTEINPEKRQDASMVSVLTCEFLRVKKLSNITKKATAQMITVGPHLAMKLKCSFLVLSLSIIIKISNIPHQKRSKHEFIY